MGIANMTELADTVNVDRVLSAIASPAFQKKSIVPALHHVEDLPLNAATATKGFRRTDSLTAAALAESTALALDANGQRTDTAVNATAAKAVVVTGLSVENQTFGQVSESSYVESQAGGIAEFVDNQFLALFSSPTNIVTATSTLTIDDLDEAEFNIISASTPDSNVVKIFIGSTQQMRDLKGHIRTEAGAAFHSEKFLSIFNGPPQQNGFYGSLPGYDLYQTPSGIVTAGGDDIGNMFHPMWAYASMYDRAIRVWREEKGGPDGLQTTLTSWFFWASVLWNDLAASQVRSDS